MVLAIVVGTRAGQTDRDLCGSQSSTITEDFEISRGTPSPIEVMIAWIAPTASARWLPGPMGVRPGSFLTFACRGWTACWMSHLNHTNAFLLPMNPPCCPTHRAPSASLSSFKNHFVAAVAAALLLVPALPASAISVNVVEDSTTRFAFDLLWESPSGTYLSEPIIAYQAGVGVIGVIVSEFETVLNVSDDFYILFDMGASSSLNFEVDDVFDFNGSQIVSLSGEPYGARFVYGTPYPADPPTGVPDHGASALLLSAGLAGLTAFRRFLV